MASETKEEHFDRLRHADFTIDAPKTTITQSKTAFSKATFAELVLQAAERGQEHKMRQLTSDEAEIKTGVHLARQSVLDPKGFDKIKKEVEKQQKALGNGLPSDCRIFFLDFEMLSEQGDAGGFGDARIFQIGITPWSWSAKQENGFVANVNPQINWSKLKPMLQRYAKSAWHCRSLEDCDEKAVVLPKFPAVFESMTKYLRDGVFPSRNVLLAGFNSTNSDRIGLLAEMKRHKLKFPEDVTIWWWDCAQLLRRLAKLSSIKWNLALLFKTVMGYHMTNAHEAYADACNLRTIALKLWSGFSETGMCKLLSQEATGITILHDARMEAQIRLETKRTSGMREARLLTAEQSDAVDFACKRIKEGTVKGLGKKHAGRLRLQHKATTFMHLFELYENDKQFIADVIRKGCQGNNMAAVAELKLLECAKHYRVPRDRWRQQEAEEKAKRDAFTVDQMKMSRERIAFLDRLTKITPDEKARKWHVAAATLIPYAARGHIWNTLKKWLHPDSSDSLSQPATASPVVATA